MGRSAILGEQRNNDFVDVACGRGAMGDSTYAITRSGLLCEFNNRRLLDKWVELRVCKLTFFLTFLYIFFVFNIFFFHRPPVPIVWLLERTEYLLVVLMES
jgi:hypothetical protein